jgi:hypothetical protein
VLVIRFRKRDRPVRLGDCTVFVKERSLIFFYFCVIVQFFFISRGNIAIDVSKLLRYSYHKLALVKGTVLLE